MISALYDWATSAATPETVIWANQDGEQPAPPYVTLQVTATSREGIPHVGDPDENGIIVIHQGQLFSLSVQVFGDDVTGLIQTMRDTLDKITVQRDLRTSGFAYVRVLSEPQDLPEITGTTWQKRANMDVQFRAAKNITDDVGLIESVAFTGGDGTASETGATVGGA